MFIQHKNDTGQSRFHKPNILRRKLKTTVTPIANESHGSTLVTPTASTNSISENNVTGNSIGPAVCINNVKSRTAGSAGPISNINNITGNTAGSTGNINIVTGNTVGHTGNINDVASITAGHTGNMNNLIGNTAGSTDIVIIDPTEQKLSHECTMAAVEDINSNVDLCLNRTLFDIDSSELKLHRSSILGSTFLEPESMEDDLIQFVLEPIELFETSTSLDLMPIETSIPCVTEQVPEAQSASETIMFKCDYEEDCKKSFPTKQKLKKHIARHMKAKPLKEAQQIFKCPAFQPKTSELDVTATICEREFQDKKDLVKHLTNDHSTEDGIHSCEKCGRRFFTVTGFRVHRRSCGVVPSRRVLPCPWEGCTRTFLQPCRLREHSRAHTGDRPYPCHHPGCTWSFRTASKLMRHARRHTGERRHACSACGASFRRREHLRDHATRHAQPDTQPTRTKHKHANTAAFTHTCRYQDCDQLFKDTKSLNAHIKSVHENNVKNEQQEASVEPLWTSDNDSFMDEPDITIHVGSAEVPLIQEDSELRSARTHCTWPLIATAAPSIAANQDHDAQVELSEGSESNTSTIRSDLFLHGNMLPIEDNDAPREVSLARLYEEAPEPYCGHVALLHAGYEHLTRTPIDLLQEELMYTDAAVDESSFQILLLSDPDLN